MKTTRKEVLEIIDQLKTCDSIDVESLLKVCEDWLDMKYFTLKQRQMLYDGLTCKINSMKDTLAARYRFPQGEVTGEQVEEFNNLLTEYINLRSELP